MSKVISEMIERSNDEDRTRKKAISITLDSDILAEADKMIAGINYKLSQKGEKAISRSQFFESAAATLIQQMRAKDED